MTIMVAADNAYLAIYDGAAKTRLFRAAELLEQYGWTRGTDRAPDGRMCIFGACAEAADRFEHDLDFVTDARIGDVLFTRLRIAVQQTAAGVRPVRWNDDVCPNKEAAVAILRSAAAVDIGVR